MISTRLRMAMAVLLGVAALSIMGSVRVEATPRQDVIEYGGVAAGGAKAAKGIGSKATKVKTPGGAGLSTSKFFTDVKDHAVEIIVAAGLVLLFLTWRWVSRPSITSRMSR